MRGHKDVGFSNSFYPNYASYDFALRKGHGNIKVGLKKNKWLHISFK
jgi:hypothetical protein